MKRGRKHIPFGKRSKRQRRVEGIWVSNEIAKYRDLYQGRFMSYCPLVDPAGSDPEVCNNCGSAQLCAIDPRMCGNSQWFEFKFLGKHKYTVWDAEIKTARKHFWHRIDNTASDRAWDMLKPEEQEDPYALFGFGSSPLVIPPQFGGLSFPDYKDQLEREILEHEPPEIYECCEADYTLHYAFGLKVVLDIDRITVPIVIDTIDRFFAMGQKPWRSEKPVARDRLPVQTEGDCYMSLWKEIEGRNEE